MATYFINENDAPAEGDAAEARAFEVETLADGRYRLVTPEGREVLVDAYAPADGRLQMIIEGKSYDTTVRAQTRADAQVQAVQVRGEFHEFEVLNARQKRMRAAGIGVRGADGPDLVSPMAGKVVAVVCAEGDTVA